MIPPQTISLCFGLLHPCRHFGFDAKNEISSSLDWFPAYRARSVRAATRV